MAIENKHVGWIMIGLSLLFIIIIFLFNNALRTIVKSSCTGEHALSCPMYTTINEQTYLALAIVGIIIIIGIILIFSKPVERLIIKKEKTHKRKIDLSDLKPEEKQALKIIQEQKTIFQADLIEKMECGNAKMSRILDRLEGQGLVERKRRGMTNVVVFKED